MVVNVDDTDRNADWIKTPENRKSEQAIHDELAEQYAKSKRDGVKLLRIDGMKVYRRVK